MDVRAEPSEGGRVEGGGSYPTAERVTVTAIPSAGWQFERWSGNLSGSGNPDTLAMEANKTLVAQFVKATHTILKVSAEPPEAGSVSEGGNYIAGTQVQVKARGISEWRFDHWSGDLSGSANPALLVMDTDKWAIAHFVRAPDKERTDRDNIVPTWARTKPATEPRDLYEPDHQPRLPRWAHPEPATEPTDSVESELSSEQQPNQSVSGPAFNTNGTQSKTENLGETPPTAPSQASQNKSTLGKAFQ